MLDHLSDRIEAFPSGQLRRRWRAWSTPQRYWSAGRFGLAARTVFYAVLVVLTVQITFTGGSGRQADANGALALVARQPGGPELLGLAAAGFVVLGAARLNAALRDHRRGWLARATTALQGLFYLGVASVPCSYLAGSTSTGSEGSQQVEVSRALATPGGRPLLAAVGVVLVAVCGWQIRTALTGDFQRGVSVRARSRLLRRLFDLSGAVGIAARSIVFAPVGVLLVVAAVTGQASRSLGVDGELVDLSRHLWGLVALALVASGLAVFTVFSALETAFRDLEQA